MTPVTSFEDMPRGPASIVGYPVEVHNALYQIDRALPLHNEQLKDSLRQSFARVATALKNGMGGQHNDFSRIAESLIQIASHQPDLRAPALNVYNALPLAGVYTFTGDKTPDIIKLCESWLRADDTRADVKLEAASLLRNKALSEVESGREFSYAVQIHAAIAAIVGGVEKESDLEKALTQALWAIESAQTEAIEKRTNAFTIKPR